jgi:hypothetical protein
MGAKTGVVPHTTPVATIVAATKWRIDNRIWAPSSSADWDDVTAEEQTHTGDQERRFGNGARYRHRRGIGTDADGYHPSQVNRTRRS